MLDENLQIKMLAELYKNFFEHDGSATLADSMDADFGVDRDTIYQNAEVLTERRLAEFITMGAIQPTSSGILFLEEKELVPKEQIALNRKVRTKILDELAKVREQHGVNGWAPYQLIIQAAAVEEGVFMSNQEVLKGQGLLTWPAMQMMAITRTGMEAVLEWRKRVAVADRYEELRSRAYLTPQQRGHDFEALLKAVVEKEGWKSEANVRASGEENDLIIHQAREYYLVQCKWEKHPVQPHYLSVLRDRMGSRAGVRGLFISLSGYTDEAIKDAVDRLEGAMMLLYGPEDVSQTMRGGTAFSALLDVKFHAAVTRREMLVDGKAHRR